MPRFRGARSPPAAMNSAITVCFIRAGAAPQTGAGSIRLSTCANTPRTDFQQEAGIANAFLQLIDGRSERSYAYTCFDTHIGRWRTRTPIAGMIRDMFVAARGARTDQPIAMSRDLDLMNLGGFLADTLPLSALTDAVKRAGDESSWLILVIHGIGAGTHHSFVEPSIHRNLLDFLASESSIWVAPVIEIAKWVRRENEEALHLTK